MYRILACLAATHNDHSTTLLLPTAITIDPGRGLLVLPRYDGEDLAARWGETDGGALLGFGLAASIPAVLADLACIGTTQVTTDPVLSKIPGLAFDHAAALLGDDKSAAGAGRLAGRAVLVSATMTASFVMLFGIAGLVTGLAASAVTSALPWTGIAVGAGLVLLGGVLATGRELGSSFGPRAAQHLRGAAVTRGISGYAAYGLASLGCTLPVFLGVVGTSFQLHGVATAAGQFMLFGLAWE